MLLRLSVKAMKLIAVYFAKLYFKLIMLVVPFPKRFWVQKIIGFVFGLENGPTRSN